MDAAMKEQLIETLTDRQKEVLELKMVQGMTGPEVAEKLELTTARVYQIEQAIEKKIEVIKLNIKEAEWAEENNVPSPQAWLNGVNYKVNQKFCRYCRQKQVNNAGPMCNIPYRKYATIVQIHDDGTCDKWTRR
jgi:DNA-binding CsgD family transcriptional regulator